MAGERRWEVVASADSDGREPFTDWYQRKLTSLQRAAVLAALEKILAVRGTAVCETEWGKNLGGGLYELRIRHGPDEIAAMFPAADQPMPGVPKKSKAPAILLRVYFTTDGRQLVLLLGGYDKGRLGEGRRQRQSIAAARDTLKRLRRERAASRQGNRRRKKPR